MANRNKKKSLVTRSIAFYQFDPQMGFWGKPGIESEVFFSQRPDIPILVKHNSDGNRSDEILLEEDEATIVCIGGSHSWGAGIGQSDIYTRKLSELAGLKVINLGHCSLGLDQVCLAILQKTDRYKPKIVIIEQYPWAVHRVLNNYVNGYTRPYFTLDAEGKLKLQKVSSWERIPVFRRMIGSFYSFRKEFNEFKAGMNIKNNFDASIDPIFLHWKTRQYDYMYNLIDKILGVIKDYCRQNDIKLLFGLGAIHQQFGPASLSPLIDYELPHHRLISLLEKNKINYVDMTHEMLSNNTLDSPVIFKDGHINEKGHKVFSRVLYKELQHLKWL